jgi:hypothetical protein
MITEKQVRKLVREVIKKTIIAPSSSLEQFKGALVDAIDASGAWKLAANMRDANILMGGKYVGVLRAWKSIEKDMGNGKTWADCVRDYVGPMIVDMTGNERLAERVVRRMIG